ncbi:MAG: hypothetical protein U0470_10910 [Anaerolineae bacterium]
MIGVFVFGALAQHVHRRLPAARPRFVEDDAVLDHGAPIVHPGDEAALQHLDSSRE